MSGTDEGTTDEEKLKALEEDVLASEWPPLPEGITDEDILAALKGVKNGLDRHSLAAVLVLTKCKERDESLIRLLKEGKIKARYIGDNNNEIDPYLFEYCKRDDGKN